MTDARNEPHSLSGLPIDGLYSPDQLAASGFDPAADLGEPGQFPFTRGAYPNMYRGRLWTRRQIAGFGTAAATNERYRFLAGSRPNRAQHRF